MISIEGRRTKVNFMRRKGLPLRPQLRTSHSSWWGIDGKSEKRLVARWILYTPLGAVNVMRRYPPTPEERAVWVSPSHLQRSLEFGPAL